MKKPLLSPEAAFRAMLQFLEAYDNRTAGKAELRDVLGDIQISRGDGMPADPAAWNDWIAAVNAVCEHRAGARARGSVR